MSISMIGIDHSMAPVDIRALFAFTRKNAGEAMEKLKEQPGIDGCIILSTCNRLPKQLPEVLPEAVSAAHSDHPEFHPAPEYGLLCISRSVGSTHYML